MADRMRWRYGDTNPVVAAVDAATQIEIGDLLWQDVDDAKPAAMLTDTGSEPAGQAEFTARFLGVAMQRSRAGEASPVRVATTGVFELDAPAANHELGDLMGPTEHAAGLGLMNQQVAPVTESHLAIGRIARRETGSPTSVLVDIRSTVMTGGVMGGNPSA
ncbi:MAG: hypothetical protein U1E05_27295 [Patescibacteria group bacterium]|nr:hypothetical protein [Patescibacteria group bacterium]